MSTSPVTGLGPGLHVLPSTERAAALNHLAASLAVLGDDASRASEHSRDVRLHVVACQAQHLAGEVLDLLPAHDTAGFAVRPIDNVGGEMLTWLTRTVDTWGNIASIGLAGGAELHTTVMPFILRGVNLLGINSVATPRELRLAVWHRLATDLRPAKLDRIAGGQVTFEELPAQFDDYIKGRVIGRTVVRIARNT